MKKIYFTSLIFPLCLCACKDTKQEETKPNVLFIAVDDLRTDEIGCYGHPIAKTPNMDKLASKGMLFTNHYVNVPTCGASRYCLLTGMLPRNSDHLTNSAIMKSVTNRPETERPETFIHHLKRNGYHTAGIGKISHNPDGLLAKSGEPELTYSWDEVIFDTDKWGTAVHSFFAYANGSSRRTMDGQVKPYEKGDVDDEGYPDGIIAKLAVDKLKELAGKETPFFLGVGFFKPHLPFNAPAKYWDLYNRENIPLSPNPYIPENVNIASLHSSYEFNNGYRLGDESATLDGPVSDEYARKLRHAYLACVSYIDAQIGKLIDELERLDIADNTIIIIWGDHGWHLGDHLVWGKHTIFERSLKSPLIINLPGLSKGNEINRIISTVDIYPTIIELCGTDNPHITDGNSFVPLLKDMDNNREDAAYGYFNRGISLRTERYRLMKYFREQQPVIELYDHRVDPNETRNIAEENPEVVSGLMPLLEKGNTGIYASEQP